MIDQCPSDNATAQFDDFSVQGMCKQGSITFVLAFVGTVLLITFHVVLHHQTKKAQRHDDEDNGEIERFSTTEKRDGKVLDIINKYLVRPFVPPSLPSFAMTLYFLWFAVTITMAGTRFYEKRWANELFFQQGPFNVLAHMLGCEGLNFTTIPYTHKISSSPFKAIGPKPQRDSSEELDWYFAWHLAGGILWLTFGFMQIYCAEGGWSSDKTVNGKAHKWFGRLIALPSFCVHIFLAAKMVIRNPVKQKYIIIFSYSMSIFDSCLMCIEAIYYIRKAKSMKSEKEKEKWKSKHILRMCFCYFQSLFGSGFIRVTAWALWITAKFLPWKYAIRIDRGACQSNAACRDQQLGSAEDCFIPVFLNLALTNLLILWTELVFVSVHSQSFKVEENDMKTLKTKAKTLVMVSIIFLPMLLFESLDKVLSPVLFLYVVLSKAESLWLHLGDRYPNNSLKAKIQGFFRRLVQYPNDDDPKED